MVFYRSRNTTSGYVALSPLLAYSFFKDMEVAPRLQPLLFRLHALSPETFSKVCKWCASKAITKESDESDSSSSTVPAVPSPPGRPLSLSSQFCSDSHLVKKFAATVQFSRVLFFLTLSSRPRKWRVPHGTVALSPETCTKVCKWRASKATTKESDESDSSSSTVLNDSSQEHGRNFRVWDKIHRTKKKH